MKKIGLWILFVVAMVAVSVGSMKVAPFVNPSDCVGCTDCVKICPVNSGKNGKIAIEIIDGHAIITPANCIKCGLCVSVCSFNAVREQ